MTEPSSSTITMTTSSMPTELDLAFIIDATGSMGSYIASAQENMRNIIQDIIISERCLLNVALILYRDHPPQDNTFIINVNDFTNDAEEAKKNIDSAYASGGGDGPEAMTPALHAAVHTLSWRKNAVKIAILIADAPPHGLDPIGDSWPNGDPSGYDPVECVALLAEYGITLYTIGCEPTAINYRDFFMSLAFKTGGQYVPLANCANLASVIVGSAKEEISLEKLISKVHEEVMNEAALRGGPIDEAELTRRLHEVMHNGGVKAHRLKIDKQDGITNIPSLTTAAEYLSTLTTLKDVREKWVSNKGMITTSTATTAGVLFSLGKTITSPSILTKKKYTRTRVIKKTPTKRKTTTKIKKIIKKKPQQTIIHGNRRSARLILSIDNKSEGNTSTDDEPMETSTPIIQSVKRSVKPKAKISNINVIDDGLLDISQTRRLVRKCVARNKLKST